MKKTIFILLLLIFTTSPLRVLARDNCEYTKKARIQKIASNVTTTYEYQEKTADPDSENKFNEVSFKVIISNVQNDIKIIDEVTGERFYNNQDGEIVIENQKPGSYLKYNIYGNIEGCHEDNLLLIYVTLPTFNKYYTDPICNNIPNYKLCNKWANVKNITYKQFSKAVEDYINELNQKDDEEIIESKITLFEKIISFLAQYSLIIFGSIIIICAGLIIYLTKKDEFDLSVK